MQNIRYALPSPRGARIGLVGILLCVLAGALPAAAASKAHAVSLGAPIKVKFFVGANETQGVDIKIRNLLVDGKLKEFTTGESHDITDSTFVIQRAFRVNDSLPSDAKSVPKWKWQRGGWIKVDRRTGHITPLRLPLFDPYYSLASWYRDYAAYCGLSDNGEKVLAVVAQADVKKPVLRRDLGAASKGEMPDADCRAPEWQKQPPRVTFLPTKGEKLTISVRGRSVDTVTDQEAGEDEAK